MLLSRFWYVFLAVAAAAAISLALLAQAVINARSDDALTASLKRDRTMVDAVLRLEARSRLDRIAFITVDNKLGGLLKQAENVTDEKKLHDIGTQTKDVLRSQVARMVEAGGGEGDAAAKSAELQPDIAFALDGDGRVIAQLGPLEANPPGAGLGTFPLVKRALQGYVRDDVWVYDRHVYRVAARPVMAGSEYAGAIVHGYRLERGLPEKLSAYLGGATIAFFFGSDMLGSHIPSDVSDAPQQAEIASAVPKALTAPKWKSGEASELIELQHGGRAVFMPITGAAATSGVGYAIARPRKVMTSPEQLFQEASQDDVKALPVPLLAGGAVGLALIGLLFLYLERDRHMKQLKKKLGEIAAGERDRLIVTEWRGAYRKLADGINQAIDKELERSAERVPSSRKKANLDELLGKTPEASSTPFFGFSSDEAKEPGSSPLATPAPVIAPAKPAPAPAAGKPVVPAPQRPPAVSPQAVAAPPLMPPPIAPQAAALPVPSIQPAVRAAAATASRSDVFDENAHFHDVYDQYVATRKQCGEAIDNLTFDKFLVTLRKTRDQIVEKQGVKSVRFAVQVKEGKAALKAQPIKG
jgi:hypothetical protein